MDTQILAYIIGALLVLFGIGWGAKSFLLKPPSKNKQIESSTSFEKKEEVQQSTADEFVEDKTSEAGLAEPHLKVEPISDKPVPSKVDSPKATKDLRSALENTRSHFFGRIKSIVSREARMTDDDMEELEEVLYTSDLGPATVQRLVEAISEKVGREEKGSLEVVQSALRGEMKGIFAELQEKSAQLNDLNEYFQMVKEGIEKPRVLMIVGVNGVGKTTTIGKLSYKAAQSGLNTMVVAGDTFRAAAEDQLKIWAERANVEIFSPEGVKDPSAVAFDGIQTAMGKKMDLVIVDTAGRLHTQDNLMEELKKMRRVMDKVLPGAPHEVLLVLDANSGQNALMQARSFHESLNLNGVILTKLDGTAKGGVAVGIACELQLPIKLIGVGEGVADLRPFN
ncbi:MAG: signal recognition particle-docking protein FtsY, partial [Bdellovibrionales bacterium]|nr:signal recognition particle-docking protein FtsY [Bdellovibrionales bacterium]